MDLKKIKEFIELAKTEGVTELKYESKEFKLAVNFGSTSALPINVPYNAPAQTGSSPEVIEKVKADNLHEIKSPFVGTFYSAPSPDKPAYVSAGQKISKGQTLCILEAMKIMNEIESDIAGEVVEVCVDNESLVEFGQILFKIRV